MVIMVGKGVLIATAIFVSMSMVFVGKASAASAETNYKFYCSQCHGISGKGDGPNATKSQPVSPRNHTNTAEMKKLTDQDIVNVIKGGGAATGKSTMMPPFGKTLSDGEVDALRDYLRKLCKC